MTRSALAAAALAAATLAAQAQTATPPADTGRRVYTSYCVRCHGINLAVGSSAFYDLRTFPKDDKARFIESVMNGKRQMPAWGSVLKADDVESLWSYVASVNGW
jgi:cytochrome c55X